MKAFRLLLFIVLSLCVKLNAKENTVYTIGAIPPALKENASAVIRLSETSLNIINPSNIVYSEHVVISVMNTEGEALAMVKVSTGKGKELKSFRASLFDASGKLIQKFGRKDRLDYSNDGLGDEISDYRTEVWHLGKTSPPYTVEYEYEWISPNSFFLPPWFPIPDEKVSVEHASFNLLNGPDTKVNYLAENLKELPDSSPGNLRWKLDNVKAFKPEFFSGNFLHVLPIIHLALEHFMLYGRNGSNRTWSDLAQFVAGLHTGRDEIQKIDDPRLAAIYATREPDSDKAKQLYAYIQNNLRYVAIGLGISGWQPQDANFTLSKKYGDCKALATLMKALLKHAGIESNCVLVFSGEDREMTKEKFPASQFNHEILCIPMQQDTFWLDCTSPYNPFNYLGSSTEGRPCLILGNEGGMLYHTPVYNEKVNQSITHFDIHLLENKTVGISGFAELDGELQDYMRMAFAEKDNKTIEAGIRSALSLPNTQISHYAPAQIDQDKPSVKFSLELSNYSSMKLTANRLFMNTELVKPLRSVPPPIEENRFTINIVKGFDMKDSLVYHLPAGYKPENFKPGDLKEIDSEFGQVKTEIILDEKANTLLLKREFVLKKAKYAANKYADYRKFMLQATKNYMPELVMRKAE